jgi:IS5 family transposase
MAADRGYASRDNLNEAKARGVEDVAFHKQRGLAVADMAKSAWVYRKLRNFRAGIEASISCFKRAYGSGDRGVVRPRPRRARCRAPKPAQRLRTRSNPVRSSEVPIADGISEVVGLK